MAQNQYYLNQQCQLVWTVRNLVGKYTISPLLTIVSVPPTTGMSSSIYMDDPSATVPIVCSVDANNILTCQAEGLTTFVSTYQYMALDNIFLISPAYTNSQATTLVVTASPNGKTA